ncbi:hypothetical protein [Microbacterium rhizomatis]|uniref:hypothetical protein n=1 Tax=Microbacterium rhizomatis TaxID=1631477 RepID=UPI0014783E8A|nr:hypothetical protein [Microbacterium rhizomatis]
MQKPVAQKPVVQKPVVQKPVVQKPVVAAPAGRRGWLATYRGALLSLIPVYLLVGLLSVSATVAATAGNGTEPPVAGTGRTAAQDAAASWLIANSAPNQALIVDAPMSGDLLTAGWSADDLFVYDSAQGAASVEQPTNWRDAAFVVTTPAAASTVIASGQVGQAVDNSTLVASFGSGTDVVQVRKVTPEGASLASFASRRDAQTRAEFGAQLAENASVRLSVADRSQLAAGRVDTRIVAVLGTLAAASDVAVTSFPVIAGEEDQPFRQVAISEVGDVALVKDGAVTPDASALLSGLRGTYAPQDITIDGASVVLRYAVMPAVG